VEYSQDNIAELGEHTLVEEVRAELEEIAAMDVSDHAQRFESLHQKLNQALSTIDGL
jgi:hypothetical protein